MFMSPTHICNVKFLGEKAYISMLHTKKSSQITQITDNTYNITFS